MKHKNKTNSGTFELIFAMLISGTVSLFVIESNQTSYTVVFYRCLFGSIFLGVYCLIRGYLTRYYLKPKIAIYIFLSAICIVMNWFFLFRSFEFTSITISTVVYQMQPIFVLLIGSYIFKTEIGTNKYIWISVAFVGMLFISNVSSFSGTVNVNNMIGIFFALTAAFLYAVTTLIVKSLTDAKPHVITLGQVLIGSVVFYPLAEFVKTPTSEQWFYLVMLGFAHTGVAYIFLYSSFQKLNVDRIAVLCFLYPVVALTVDYVVYDYRINLYQTIGIIMVIGGIIGVNFNLGKYYFAKRQS